MKIRDSYMFKEKSPYKKKSENASHWYFVYDKHKPIYVKGLTHLYTPDRRRFSQVKDGQLVQVKISGFQTPSGLYNEPQVQNAEGKAFRIKDIVDNTIQERERFRYRKIGRKGK